MSGHHLVTLISFESDFFNYHTTISLLLSWSRFKKMDCSFPQGVIILLEIATLLLGKLPSRFTRSAGHFNIWVFPRALLKSLAYLCHGLLQLFNLFPQDLIAWMEVPRAKQGKNHKKWFVDAAGSSFRAKLFLCFLDNVDYTHTHTHKRGQGKFAKTFPPLDWTFVIDASQNLGKINGTILPNFFLFPVKEHRWKD